jgi:peptidoglycan/xylan/chitin deacetylase (PgdA/CDA1 family)
MALPGIATSFVPDGRQLALTFDACPGGGYDDALVDTLRRNQVPAVLFLNARWIDQHPDRAAELAADPLFEIGNHGSRHVPLSVTGRSAYGIPGTRSPAEVVDEVAAGQQRIAALTGKPPTWFRPGTAHYDDVAVSIVHDLGERPLGFTVNGDAGATLPAANVRANLLGAAPGSIVISHMNHPEAGTGAGYAAAIPQLRAAGWEFVPLRDRVVQ